MNRIELEDILFELHDKGLRNQKFSITRVTNQVERYANKRVIEELERLIRYYEIAVEGKIKDRIEELKRK
jgi:hypothetical protein